MMQHTAYGHYYFGHYRRREERPDEPIAGYNVEHDSEEELILFAKVITQIIEGDL